MPKNREVRPCGREDVLFFVLERQFCCAAAASNSIRVNFFFIFLLFELYQCCVSVSHLKAAGAPPDSGKLYDLILPVIIFGFARLPESVIVIDGHPFPGNAHNISPCHKNVAGLGGVGEGDLALKQFGDTCLSIGDGFKDDGVS